MYRATESLSLTLNHISNIKKQDVYTTIVYRHRHETHLHIMRWSRWKTTSRKVLEETLKNQHHVSIITMVNLQPILTWFWRRNCGVSWLGGTWLCWSMASCWSCCKLVEFWKACSPIRGFPSKPPKPKAANVAPTAGLELVT